MMKKFIAVASLLVGCLGGMEGHVHAGSCPTSDNVKVRNFGYYEIEVPAGDCKEHPSILITGDDTSFKAREGSYVEFPLPKGGSCKKEVPVGKKIEITARGTLAFPICDSKIY